MKFSWGPHGYRHGARAKRSPRLRMLALPQCHLTAGSLFHTVRNSRSGREADADVKDDDGTPQASCGDAAAQRAIRSGVSSR
jgi:hypothetical protein